MFKLYQMYSLTCNKLTFVPSRWLLTQAINFLYGKETANIYGKGMTEINDCMMTVIRESKSFEDVADFVRSFAR